MNKEDRSLKDYVKESSWTYEGLSEALDVSKSTIYRALKDPNKYADVSDRIYDLLAIEKSDIRGGEDLNKNEIVYNNGELTAKVVVSKNPANLSLDEIVELFGLDEEKWECVKYRANAWNTSMKDKNNQPMVSKNYSVSAQFKPRQKPPLVKEDLSWLYDGSKEYFTEDVTPNWDTYSDNVLVLPILDAHIGKLAWGDETGENYDVKIAVKRYRTAVRNIVGRAHDIGFKQVIFPLGNDFFQTDNTESETTRGTRVDSDIRWKKLFKVGMELLRDTINYCSQYAPVDVILVQGNHDAATSFYAFEALRGYYENSELVDIDTDIKARTYRRIGPNLIGFTHGDKEKNHIYEIMQQEARDLWGKTKYSEWITGHYHKSYMDEKHGVLKRVVSSISGTDAWHYENGYVGALKGSQGILYNENMIGPYVIIHDSINLEEEEEQF